MKKNIKIGLVSPFLPEKDGIAIYSDNLLREFGKNRKHIITIGRKGSKADYIINFKSFSLKKELEKIIKREKLNLIHIQYVATFFSKYFLNYNLIAALNLPIPIISTLHEVHYSTHGLRNRILEYIEKKIIKKSDKIIVHTPKQKEFLERLPRQGLIWKKIVGTSIFDKKYKTNKIVMIYHGLRLNKIPQRKNKKNILCFGMISRGKGIPYLINAMKYLLDYKLIIAGKFVDKKTKEDVVAALEGSIPNIKTDFGWIEEENKERYYKDANIVVLPHIWAPYQSGILHNAVAWGLPVVVTRVGALWEIVDKFRLGEIVKPKNPKAIADSVKKIFKSYNYYKKGIERYRKEACWKNSGLNHIKLYRSLLGKKDL